MDILKPLPGQWRVILTDGHVLGLWADGVSERHCHYEFSVLVDASPEEQQDRNLVIDSHNPSNPNRISVIVARIPMNAVQDIWSGHWDE